MSNKTPPIKIKKPKGLPLSKKGYKKIKKGEILHLTLSFINDLRDINNLNLYIKQALAFFEEKPEMWDMQNDFELPLQNIFSLPQIRDIFSVNAKKVFIEKSILIPDKKNPITIFRPDRVVLFKDYAVVVDFKSEKPSAPEVYSDYKRQIENYCMIVKKLFQLPVVGYLLFILEPEIEMVVK